VWQSGRGNRHTWGITIDFCEESLLLNPKDNRADRIAVLFIKIAAVNLTFRSPKLLPLMATATFSSKCDGQLPLLLLALLQIQPKPADFTAIGERHSGCIRNAQC
jgi:hypothetical protein